jgi:hypothetical protein
LIDSAGVSIPNRVQLRTGFNRMRKLTAPLLVMASALTVSAQSFVQRVNGPQVIIGTVGWTTSGFERKATKSKSDSRRTAPSTQPEYRAEDSPHLLTWRTAPEAPMYFPYPEPPVRKPKQTQPSVEVGFDFENRGSQRIVALEWTIQFVDRARGIAYHLLQFHSTVEVEGKRMGVSSKTPFDKNWERLNADIRNNAGSIVIAIASIEYADGSRWQRP